MLASRRVRHRRRRGPRLGIGKANGLPWPKLRATSAHFKRITSTASEGKRNAIVMGRKTWESKPRSAAAAAQAAQRRGSHAARPRRRPRAWSSSRSVDAALDAALAGEAEATFVVGGAEIFREAFAHADLRYVYLTRIEQRFGCDVQMPDLDARGFVRDAWEGEREAEEFETRYRIERLKPPAGRQAPGAGVRPRPGT